MVGLKLGKLATIRTGLVFSRKEAPPNENYYKYNALSLKNITEDRQINKAETDVYYASEQLKEEFFTQNGDVLLRLSAPYTAVLITETEIGLLIPSHFAIIRAGEKLDPYYLHWWLGENKKQFYKNASGATIMGTISSGFIAEMDFEPLKMEMQKIIGEIFALSNQEQQLLSLLADKRKLLTDVILKRLGEKK